VTESPPVKPFRNREEMERTERHEEAYRTDVRSAGRGCGGGRTSVGDWSGLTHRIALSCLVDGDHSDTARHYGEPVPGPGLERRWGERLEALTGSFADFRNRAGRKPPEAAGGDV